VIACDRWPLSEPEPRCYNRACFTVNIPALKCGSNVWAIVARQAVSPNVAR